MTKMYEKIFLLETTIFSFLIVMRFEKTEKLDLPFNLENNNKSLQYERTP